MNEFGGSWTEEKIEVFIKYIYAYLTIMQHHPYFKLLYFDGFAGSGTIENSQVIEGVATKVLSLSHSHQFDMYYFVDKKEKNAENLRRLIKENFPNKKTYVVAEDCNKKIIDMCNFLNKNKNYRALVFLDPYGMQIEWSSLVALKNLGVDMWILVPTGQGVNRLLKKDGNISDAWWQRLERFLGMKRDEIYQIFYKENRQQTLFGDEIQISKYENSIQKLGNLYKDRLKTLFKFVSNPLIMKNKRNTTLFHFFLASNNSAAQKIANDIVKPYFK